MRFYQGLVDNNEMKMKLFDKVLFRVPQFPKDATLASCWPKLKASIKDASSYFYNKIKDLDYSDIENQPKAVQHTIAKYFNRSKFRATPYGTFAGIGVCSLANDVENTLLINDNTVYHQFVDWKYTEQFKHKWKTQPIHTLLIQANTTYYRMQDSIRYIYRGDEHFELSDIPYYPEVEFILGQCIQTVPYPELEISCATIDLGADQLHEIIYELIESQLLFCQYQPNIIGDDYFQQATLTEGFKNDILEQYTLCRREVASGTLQKKDFTILTELIDFLHQNQPNDYIGSELTTFIAAFSRKYDMQAIPLMEALDPVIGIGYGDMEQTKASSAIVRSIRSKSDHSDKRTLDSNLEDAIKSEVSKGIMTSSVIQIENLGLPSNTRSLLKPLANTVNLILQKKGQLLQVEHISGASATSLIGRFNIIGGDVLQMSKQLADIETESNPDVLFFDIAYCGEPQVDNINRRQDIYPYHVCISNRAGSHRNLALNDIDISIQNNSVILTSRSHQKRLVPRLSTAYNYTRSDLSLFRFLCDIQMQDVATLSPNWNHIFRNSTFTPRIQFKNIILSPASWHIKYTKEQDDPKVLKAYLSEIKTSRYIKIGEADQTLMLDLVTDTDIELLQSILKLKGDMKLFESFTVDEPAIEDTQGNTFCSEFMLSMYHHKNVYKPFQLTIERDEDLVRRFPLGSEWIYYKIYCHPTDVNIHLLPCLKEIVHQVEAHMAGWFFIRYNESGDHIRFRMKLKNESHVHLVTNYANKQLALLLEKQILSDYSVHTYEREIERYGANYISAIEALFCKDTTHVMGILQYGFEESRLYEVIVRLMLAVGGSTLTSTELSSLIQVQKDYFNREHDMDSYLFKELNQEYKLWIAHYDDSEIPFQIESISASYIELLSEADPAVIGQLYCDLFHMHINRMFSDSQRIHEMIIYNYLSKLLHRQWAY